MFLVVCREVVLSQWDDLAAACVAGKRAMGRARAIAFPATTFAAVELEIVVVRESDGEIMQYHAEARRRRSWTIDVTSLKLPSGEPFVRRHGALAP